MSHSVLQVLGLPDGFGYVVLVLALVLSLAPWLHGHDFGVLKIPDFPEAQRRVLKVSGPCALAVAIAAHVPLLGDAPRTLPVPAPALPPTSEASQRSSTAANARDADETLAAQAQDGSEVAPDPLTSTPNPRRVLAEWEGSKCLYPADLVGQDAGVGRLAFQFDNEISEMPLTRIFVSATPEISVGAQLYAKLAAREAWLPVTVEEFRQHNVRVTRSEDALCAAEFGDATKWVPRDTLSDVQPIGD